ncbi:MAG: hypothetical protein AB8B55_12930 [Mariniblastus sp.]
MKRFIKNRSVNLRTALSSKACLTPKISQAIFFRAKFLWACCLILGWSLIICSASVVAQSGNSTNGKRLPDGTRELDRSIVPTPQELFNALSALNRESGFQKSLFEKLEDSAFANLDEPTKERLREKARDLLESNGLDSPEGIKLMEQFGNRLPDFLGESGLDPALLEQIRAGEFGSMPSLDNPSFKDLAEKFNSSGLADSMGRSKDWRKPRAETSEKTNASKDSNALGGSGKSIADMFKKSLPRNKRGGNSQDSKLRIPSRINSLVTDAVSKSLKAENAKLKLPESVDNMLESVVDKVRDSVVKNKSKIKSNAKSFKDSISNSNSKSSKSNSSNSQSGWEQSSSAAASTTTGNQSSTRSLSEALKEIPQIPTIDPSRFLMWLVVVAAVGFLIYLLWRNIAVESVNNVKQKIVKIFGGTKTSPSGLVGEFDRLLIEKFGADSNWWNSQYAKNALISAAPEFKTKISDLISLYVQARYMRQDFSLTEDQKKEYKTTIQELMRLSIGDTVSKDVPSRSQGIGKDDLLDQVDIVGVQN